MSTLSAQVDAQIDKQPAAESVADFSALEAAEVAEAASVSSGGSVTAPEVPVTLVFEDLSFAVDVPGVDADGRKIQTQRYILRNLNGVVEPGQCLCVMGPTGSGKTTFLDALAGRIGSGHVGGSIRINGIERDKLGDGFARVAAFVPQFEALHSTLTVWQTILFAAELNLASSLPREKLLKRCEDVLHQMGLWSVKDSLVGGPFLKGLSGGQRKRLSIAVELVTAKALMFLDEPTTGLDSSSAMFVMETVINLARKYGCTVVCTIHQPQFQLFEMFDQLLLLSRGKPEYLGPASEASAFFAACGVPVPMYTNPADHFLDVLNTDFSASGGSSAEEAAEALQKAEAVIATMHNAYSHSAHYQRISQRMEELKSSSFPAIPRQAHVSSTVQQLSTLLKRNFVDTARNPLTFWASFVQYTFLALFMGLLYLNMPLETDQVQNRISLLFFLCAFCSFMKISALPGFVEQREVFVRERLNGYYPVWTYAVANAISSFPFVLVTAYVAAVAVYFLANLRDGASHFFYFASLFAVTLYAAEGLVVAFSALIPMYIIGLALASGAFGLYMLMCGFFIPKTSLPDGWIWAYYISLFTYAFRSFLYNEFDGVNYTMNGTGGTVKIAGSEFLSRFKADSDTMGMDFGIIVGMAIFYRFLFYLCLKFLQTGKR